jgi:hypothetical protein
MPQLSLVSQFGSPTLTSLRVTGNTILGSNLNILGSVTISGSLTAQSLIVNTTNVITGSTIFGSSLTDFHRFTGSVLVTGSMGIVGPVTATSFAGSGASLTSIPNGALNNSTISGIALGSSLATLTIGTGLSGTSYNGSTGVTIANSDRGSSQNIFKNFAVSGQSTVVAEINDDTLTLVGSGATTITTNASTDTITISSVNTTYSVGDGGLTQVNFTTTRRDKLDGIAAGATNVTNNNQLTNGAGYITSAGSISGNAATATKFSSGQSNWSGTGIIDSVIGMMAWKNYSNNHVIFDASNSTTPSGTACNNTNSTVAWTGTYPTIMGWNGSSTYGVRVDSARVADSANSVAWTNVSSRPTALSQFSNDLGNYGNWYSNNGGTISGNVTINGSSNTVLTLNATEPHIRIASTGGSNVAGVVIVPTSGYDAFVGNFNNGATNIMASSIRIGQFRKDTYFTPNGGNCDLRMGEGTNSSQGSISLYGSNFGNGYEGRLNCLNNDGNTHFYHRNNSATMTDIGYWNDSGIYSINFGPYSDIRLKDVIETNPDVNVDGIDIIKFTFKSHPNTIRYGYSAQQVQSIFPDLVINHVPISGIEEDGILTLNYNDLYVLKIAALEKKVAQLQADILALKP